MQNHLSFAGSDFVMLIEKSISASLFWQIEPRDALDSGRWIRLRHTCAKLRRQGWKLHVSATMCSALEVLEKSLPILLSEIIAFKVTASIEVLASLNRGEYGYSQIGKFITIYPTSDDQAMRLAADLHGATHGLGGPAIPSDCPFRRGSLIHFRFGAFSEQLMQTAAGTTVLGVLQPNGVLVPDLRHESGIFRLDSNPFAAPPDFDNSNEDASQIGRRFWFLTTIHRSARGTLHLCLDSSNGKLRVLKQADRDCVVDLYGRDARDRLKHESQVLAKLSPDSRFPEQFGLIEDDDSWFLILEYLPGETLRTYMERLSGQGSLPSPRQVVELGIELAEAMQKLHSIQFVYRDLKPENVLLTTEGTLQIVALSWLIRYLQANHRLESALRDISHLNRRMDFSLP